MFSPRSDNVTKKFPTLYGLTSKGVVKSWKISVTQMPLEAVILVEHGQLEGKKQLSPESIRVGLNIGKSNETTPYQQACLEAESKWKKKHDANYSEKLPEGESNLTLKLLPMLAQKYKERAKYIVWPAFIQPKLNGVRCLVERKNGKITFWSRKAKQYKNFNLYMEQDFLSIMKDGDILDGEMYNHGDITFQELMSLIKNEKTPDLVSLKKYVKFHNYDRPSMAGGFKTRFMRQLPDDPYSAFWTAKGLHYIIRVETIKIHSHKDILTVHGEYTQAGYEGSIIRSGGDEPYNFQYRDNQLQKYKDFEDAEFKIIGAEEGTGKDEGQATLIAVTPQGIGGRTGIGDFGVKCKGPNAIREEQWQNRKSYIGKEVTVRYQVLSDEFIPIFPVGLIVRDYE
jgi:DNA ligase 1